MSRDIITSALTDVGTRVHIENAEPKGRYRGASPHHQDCELYPVFRKAGRRSSFAHIPHQPDACGPGESAVHREACESWLKFFESQLNGCILCMACGIESSDHICPAVRFQNGLLAQAAEPVYGEIVWTCRICLRVHMWDLLDGAVRAISNRQVPGLDSRIRPDITLLGEDDKVLAFLEFRRSHLSNSVKDVAADLGIPLFVVDLECSLAEFQTGLNNPRRSMWEAIRPSNTGPEIADLDRKIAEFDFRIQEDIGQQGGVAGSFCAIPDDNGNLIDVVFHATGKSQSLPEPSIGGYLVAGESNLTCESQRRWMSPPDAW